MSRMRVGNCVLVIGLLFSIATPQQFEARGMPFLAGRTDDQNDGGTNPAQRKMAAAIPSNIFIRKDFQAFVARLLLLSPTFNRQYQRIASTRDLRVTINVVAPMTKVGYRARCMISKVEGLAIVNMEIVALGSYAEAIGHEFEHLLEQLDGLDLRALANERGSGVVRQGDGSFETRRAISAGRTVGREYFEHLHDR